MALFRRRPEVVLYTTPNCSDCAAVKRFLDTHQVTYREKDITSDAKHLEEMRRASGVRIAPVTVVAGQAFYGTFARQRKPLKEALQAQRLIKEHHGR